MDRIVIMEYVGTRNKIAAVKAVRATFPFSLKEAVVLLTGDYRGLEGKQFKVTKRQMLDLIANYLKAVCAANAGSPSDLLSDWFICEMKEE